MPDYQNFTNPVIPSEPSGWAAMNQNLGKGMNSLTQMLMQRELAKQTMQQQMALEAGKSYADVWAKNQDPIARALTMGKLGQLGFPVGNMGGMGGPDLGQLLQGNPYANTVFPNGIPQSAPMQGNQQSQQMPFMGGNPMMGGGGSMSLVNPMGQQSPQSNQGDLVAENIKMGLFGPMPPDFTNIPAVQKVEGAKKQASDMATARAGATVSSARDIQQLGMIKNALKPLVQSYETALSKGFAGDKYGSNVVKNLGWIPSPLQGKVVPKDIQNASGQFISNKNELITKMQPLLSQQFGQAGSTRIMESLLNMSGGEVGDLSTPRDQFHGQVEGTMRSLYRIAKASEAYKQDLENSGQKPNENTAAQEIFNRMQLQQLSPEEDKNLQGMIDDVLGKNKQIFQNPIQNSSQKNIQNFSSEKEALSARLPKGTIIMIGNRKARID